MHFSKNMLPILPFSILTFAMIGCGSPFQRQVDIISNTCKLNVNLCIPTPTAEKKPNQPTLTTTVTDTQTDQLIDGKTTTTKTTSTQTVTNPPATQPSTQSTSSSSGSTQAISANPVETVFIQSAVQECIRSGSLANHVFAGGNVGTIFTDGAVTLAEGLLSVATGPVGATSTLVVAFTSSVTKAISGSQQPTEPTISNLYTAANAYVTNSQNLIKDENYYAGLWNSIGSACPQNPQQLFGGFKMAKFTKNYTPYTPEPQTSNQPVSK